MGAKRQTGRPMECNCFAPKQPTSSIIPTNRATSPSSSSSRWCLFSKSACCGCVQIATCQVICIKRSCGFCQSAEPPNSAKSRPDCLFFLLQQVHLTISTGELSLAHCVWPAWRNDNFHLNGWHPDGPLNVSGTTRSHLGGDATCPGEPRRR